MKYPELIIVHGPGRGEVYPLPEGSRLLIGRSPDSDIHLQDKRVSRHHARIEVQEEKVILMNLSERNPTLHNNKPVDRSLLKSGDQLRIGHQIILFIAGESSHTLLLEEMADRTQTEADSRILERRSIVVDQAGSMGKYRLEGTLAFGGMGTIYEAIDPTDSTPVAVKVLRPDLRLDSVRQQRFAREIRISERLEHPHIVRFLDAGSENDIAFLVTERIQGCSIRSWILDNGPAPPDRAVRWGIEIGEALAYAHSKQVVHRDLKPSNILIEEATDSVKILDFGLGRLLDENDLRLTGAGQAIGTLRYMSPEQFSRPLVADERSDIYGLGILLYVLISGSPPFYGSRKTEIREQILTVDPPPISAWGTHIPDWLDPIVSRALQKEPEDRFDSANEVVEALRSGASEAEPEQK